MSVTLFYCSKCDRYTMSGAIVMLEIDAQLNASRGRLFADVRIEQPIDGFSPDDIVRSQCPGCEESTQLVVLDECPHFWVDRCSNRPTRVCIFCGERQYGKAVFDE